jgi:hypothetical protein
MADRDGLLLAHDIIEHQNGHKNIGTVWDELEALGAIWYVRGQWGNMMQDRPSYHSPEVSIASDVTRMFGEFSADPDFGPGGLKAGSRPHDHDESFESIVAIARADIPREHRDMGHGNKEQEDENGWDSDLHALFADYLTLALHRMRIGFRKAKKRFEAKGASRHNAGNMMYSIKEAIQEVAPHLDYEGQEFVLTYTSKGATCRPISEPEEY